MHTLTLAQIKQQLDNKKISSVEITQHFLERINKYNNNINSFITITSEEALKQAKTADEKRKNGDNLPLLGIPIAHKDLFCTAGVRTTAASKMLANFVPPYTATVVKNLEEAGMVTIGKLNTDEFAMGSSNQTSYFGVVKNPWDTNKVPGGSSGGSAAAVAARITPIATGTDTGGSIRQPAAFTGLTGLKPTYGRCSRFGMIAYASSLDQAGLLAQNAEDLAIVLEHMTGFDAMDSTSSQTPVDYYTKNLNNSLNGLKIGVVRAQLDSVTDTNIATSIENAVKLLEKQGAEIKDVSLKNFDTATQVYYIIAASEASSNLSRFDGIRFGHRASSVTDLNNMYIKSRTEGFGAEVQRRILVGTYMLSAGLYDAYYVKAQKVRRLIKNDFLNAFLGLDAIILPTTPRTAWSIGEKQDITAAYLEDKYSTPANLAGLPAISINVGESNNMPIGMQIIAPYFKESLLLNISHKFQLETNWHKVIPVEFQ